MNTIRKSFHFIAVFLIMALINACSSSDGDDSSSLLGEWYKKSDFEGVGRSGAVVITIGDKAYMGTGYDGTKWLKDWWEYDAERDFWLRKADFPGTARSAAVAFTVNGRGYVGTGYDGSNHLRDFWEYDPETNIWEQINDFDGTARYGAVAFTIDNRGFIGTGYDGNYLKDIWEYIPDTDSWAQRVSVGGSKRVNAFALAINGKAYVGGGKNNGVLQQDLWEYDPINDSWNAKTDLDEDDNTIARELAATFVINGYGYIAVGTVSGIDAQVWEYDATNDAWTQKTSFEGPVREGCIGFAIDGKGYLSTGRAGSLRYDDIWLFDPLAVDTD
jgi:N-acetylneuraminic acid mutarotase